jgi:hypothetical protein
MEKAIFIAIPALTLYKTETLSFSIASRFGRYNPATH